MENHKNPFAVFSLKYPEKDKLGGDRLHGQLRGERFLEVIISMSDEL